MATHIARHSCVISPHLKDALSQAKAGKYGRMFPGLPAPACDEAILLTLGRSGSYMDADAESPEQQAASDNPRIPAGFTFIGQFVAHDITADRSLLQHHARLNELRNFRTPRLDLESLYSAGPTGSPYIYDIDDADKFLLGINDVDALNDLPRNRQGRAILGDPRDDVHLIISQLHLAFLKFHNAVVDSLREQGVEAAKVFGEAQRLVRWHYQWIVAHEFLPLTVGEELMQDILSNGLKFYSYKDGPYIPVEFADAAYRYGHSQVRQYYYLNDGGARGQVFPDYQGTCPVNHDRTIDWAYFFNVDAKRPPQASKRIDTILAHALINLPSGEAIARVMGVAPLTPEEVGLRQLGWKSETPLWYYILREAEVRYNGEHMGEVGGRIVAEVLMGLIDDDPTSYLNAESAWHPTLPAAQPGNFMVADLLRFARVA